MTNPRAAPIRIMLTIAMLVLAAVVFTLKLDAGPPATPEAVGVEILGNRDLSAPGDTATLCSVGVFSDGTYRLGHVALFMEYGNSNFIEIADAHRRCAPLLKARGISPEIPLTTVKWRSANSDAKSNTPSPTLRSDRLFPLRA